ncbi:MAG: hypothetical protein IJH61_03845 [Eubacteriaceae bacterium]|nr:hypothetical protein [Eubacteriaceae bacterium]
MSDTTKIILCIIGVLLFVACAPTVIFLIGSVLSSYISTLGIVVLIFLITVVIAYYHRKSKDRRKDN